MGFAGAFVARIELAWMSVMVSISHQLVPELLLKDPLYLILFV